MRGHENTLSMDFSRRLKTLVRCIENTFEILPLDQGGALRIESDEIWSELGA